MVSVVDGRVGVARAGLGPDRARDEDRAEHGHAVEEEAELGRDVRRRPEERDEARAQACEVAGSRRAHLLGPPA